MSDTDYYKASSENGRDFIGPKHAWQGEVTMNEIEEILRHLYATAVQDADGVSAGKKTYHMRYDEVPKIVAQQISDLIKQSKQELIENIQRSLPKQKKVTVNPGQPAFEVAYNSAISEVTTILKQAKEGL